MRKNLSKVIREWEAYFARQVEEASRKVEGSTPKVLVEVKPTSLSSW